MEINTFRKIFCLIAFVMFAGLSQVAAQCPTVTDPTQSFCDLQSPTVADLQATPGANGLAWYASPTGGTPLSNAVGLTNGTTYYADNASGTCSPRIAVTVTIYRRPDGQPFQGPCVDTAEQATLADFIVVGNNIQWYATPTGGTPLPLNTQLIEGTIYYASQTNPDTGCETSRLAVLATVGVVPEPTGPPVQQFCISPGNPTPTINDLVASGNNNWYSTPSSAVPLSLSTPLVDGQFYYATTVDPPCESDSRLQVEVDLVTPPNPGTNGTLSICQNLVATTPPVNLFSLLGGSPQNTGTWSGPVATANGALGTVNVSGMTVAGSPYVFTYTINNNSCGPQTSTVTITILPVPTASASGSATVCANSPASVTFTGTPNATVTYNLNGGPSQTITLNASGTAILTGTYATTTVVNLVSVFSSSTPACSQTLSGSVTITVLPLPTASIASNISVCAGQPATVTITGTPNAVVTYNINGGSAQTITLNASGTATLTNTFPATTTVSLTSVASAGTPSCIRPLASAVVITVVPLPTVAISGTATVCQGDSRTITFTGTPNAVVTYNINGGPSQTIPLNAAGTATITSNFSATTSYNLISVATAGTPSCSQPQSGSATITVTPPPVASVSGNATICSGQSASIVFTGAPNATVTYTLNGGANQTIVLNAGGNATLTGAYTSNTVVTLVSVTSAGTPACTAPATGLVTINVIPLPVASISSSQSVCPGTPATVTFTGTPNAVVSYNINGGPAQTITLNESGTATLTGTYAANTTINLISVATAGTPTCSRALTGNSTITVLPAPTASISGNATICSGQQATVTFTGTPNAVITYTINGGSAQTITLNGSGTAVLTNTYTANTAINLVSISSSGTPSCTTPLAGSVNITVQPLPLVSVSGNATICAGQSSAVIFTGTPNAIVTYTVNGGPNQTITLNAGGTATLLGTYTNTSTINLVSVATAGTPSCSQPQTGTVTITVIPAPTASISVSSNPLCSGGTATITFTGTPNAVVTYNVNGGSAQTIALNASGTATITTTFTATTVYNLVSVTTSGTPSCTQPVTGSITLNVLPLPTAAVTSSQTICSGSQVTITFTGTPNAIATYTVNGGANQTIALNASGTATLTNTYTSNTTITLVSVATTTAPICTQPLTGSVTVTVQPLPVATISGTATVCSGSPATITFTGTPNAVVTYTVDGGANQSITLNASGTAALTNTYSATTTISLVSVSTSGTPGCSQPVTGSVTITVLPLPIASITPNQTICSGTNASVTITGTANATVTYTLNGGAPQTVTLNAAGVATISGSYTTTTVIALTSVTSVGTPACVRPLSTSVTLTVIPLPTASLSADVTICEGQTATVTFTGTPNAVVTYNINGGANQTITLNGSGTATIASTYSTTTIFNLVSVATTGAPACSQPLTDTMTITVLPPPTAAMAVSSNPVCAGADAVITFTGTPNAVVSYTLNGGPAQTIALDASGTATLTTSFTVNTTISLVSAATGGTPSCSQPLNSSVVVSVLTLPTASISGNADICPNGSATITFTGTPNAVVTYTVNGGAPQTIALNGSGNAFINNTFSVNTVFELVGVATTGTPSCVQPLTGTATITIQEPPMVTISTTATEVCAGSAASVVFNGTPGATVTYNVDGGSAQTVVLNGSGTATVTFNPTANATVNLVSATTNGTPGCTAPLSGSITIPVLPLPIASVSGGQPVCIGSEATIVFTGTPNAIVTYTVNGSDVQTITLDDEGNATFTDVFTSSATFALVSVATTTGTICSQPASGSTTVTVVPLPAVSISAEPTSVCSGSFAVITFTGTPNAIVTYNINGGEPQTIQLNDTGVATSTPLLLLTSKFNLVSVTTTGPEACTQPQSGSVTVNVSPLPEAGESVDNVALCTNDAPVDLFTLLGATAQPGGVWTPALTSGTGVFNPAVDAAGTYTYFIAGIAPCPDDSATVAVSLTQAPNAGTDAVLNTCSNADPTDLFGLLGNAQQGGTWSPALASGTSVFNPAVDAGGTYTYTIAGSGACEDDTATIVVTVTPGPDAGQDGALTLCTDSVPQDLFNFLGGAPQAGGTWSPALTSGTGVFNPAVDAPGIYTYTFFGNQPCDNDTATVTVTVNPIPNAGEDGNAFFCSNYAPADLIGFLGGNPQPGGTWSPALASGTGVFNPAVDVPGVYTYSVGGTFCSLDTATVTVTVVQSPNAGGPGQTLTACINSTGVNLLGGLNGSQGAGVWTDNGNTGALAGNTFNPSAAGVGTHTFTYTVSGGVSPCTTDTAVVTVIVEPLANAGIFSGVQTVCPSAGTFDLSALLDGEVPGGTWTGAGGETVDALLPVSNLTAGTYSFIYTIVNSCGSDNETVQLTVLPAPTLSIPNITLATPICLGSASTVNFAGLADGTYQIAYSLSGSNTAATQTVTVTIASGSGSISIPASQLVNAGTTTIQFESIQNTTTLCSTALQNVLVNVVITSLPSMTGANISVANICQGSPLPVSIANAAIADGNYQFSFSLSGASVGNGVSTPVTVTDGNGQFVIPASFFGTFGSYDIAITAIVNLAGGCSNPSVTATSSFNVLPIPDLDGAVISAPSSCAGLPVTVTIGGATSLSDGTYTFNYQLSGASTFAEAATVAVTGGSGSFVIPGSALNANGTVFITITDVLSTSNNCGSAGAVIEPISIVIEQPGTPQLIQGGNEFCKEDSPTVASLSANIEGTQDVLWYDAATGGNAIDAGTPLQDGETYHAALVASAGCESTIRLEVTVTLNICEEDDIAIPDGFSPNDDGINDEFVIINLPERYPNFRLQIYNRYGNVLYRGNANTPNWDGRATEGGIKVGSGVVPVGVYFYILEFNDGSRKPVQGRLYLSR